MKKKVNKRPTPKPQDYGKICLCTHKHASHLLIRLQERIEAFQVELYGGSKTIEEVLEDRPSGQTEFDKFARDKANLLSILKKQPFIPNEQSDMILIGSGPVLKLDNGNPKAYFYDTGAIGNSNAMIIRSSPIGEAIWEKKVGDTGTYIVGKKTHTFEVVQILPYSQAKQIFPSTRKVKDETPIPEPGPAIMHQDQDLVAQATT